VVPNFGFELTAPQSVLVREIVPRRIRGENNRATASGAAVGGSNGVVTRVWDTFAPW
jgi:hypothetical protein